MPPEAQQTAATSAASEPAGVGAPHAGHHCQAATEAEGGDSSKVSSQCALAPAPHSSATDGGTAAGDSASATQGAAADATEGADLSADSVIEGSESASPVPAVTCVRPEPMLSESALEEAAGADLEETVDHALAQLVDELFAAAVAEFLALSGGVSQPADPAMAASEPLPANVHDAFSDPTHAAVYSADGQHAQHQAADVLITQAQPAEAHSAETVKAEAADAEARTLAGDTAQAHSAVACRTEVHGPDTDMAAACTAHVRVAAIQLTEPDDGAVAADSTEALLTTLPGASSSDNAFAVTVQAVTTAAPKDAALSDTAETQAPAGQLADSQPTESLPLELTQSLDVTHSAAESAEDSIHNGEGQPQAALSLSRLQLELQFMHEREAVREREVEQMRQQVTEVEHACKVAVEREVGHREEQNARLQRGKQVCYGPQG